MAKGVGNTNHIRCKFCKCVGLNGMWLIRLAVTTHVISNGREASVCDGRNLVTPAVPALWPAVTKDNKWPFTLNSEAMAEAICGDDLKFNSR